MSVGAAIPGLTFVSKEPLEAPSPLRSDIAGFVGRTRRGPPNRMVRVMGWRDYCRMFGGLSSTAILPYSIRGYFENGGQIAHVIRLISKEATSAEAVWTVGEIGRASNQSSTDASSDEAFGCGTYRISAKNPGSWANNTRISIDVSP